jgi:hypothetical protein
MLTHYYDGHQCGLANSIEESRPTLVLLLEKQQNRQFQFHASDPAVFLVLWNTYCSL